MRIRLEKNVKEAAFDRVEWLFKEFDTVVVAISGGKDSTVILDIAIKVAKSLGRLPIPVVFIDEEGEWEVTIEYIKKHIKAKPEVDFRWYQIPLKIENALSFDEPYLIAWDPAKEDIWLRPKEPDSIKENNYGTMNFYRIFGAILRVDFKDMSKVCYVNGLRARESMRRYIAMSNNPAYKGITWSIRNNTKENYFTFSPIYDWELADIWHYIYENELPYNELYDLLFWEGMAPARMRVSSLFHENAVGSIPYLQKIEPQTYERLVRRIPGLHAGVKLKEKGFRVKSLPPGFKDWKEYRDFLFDFLIPKENKETVLSKIIKPYEKYINCLKRPELVYKAQIKSFLANDAVGTRFMHFTLQPFWLMTMEYAKGKIKWEQISPKIRKYIRRDCYGIFKT